MIESQHRCPSYLDRLKLPILVAASVLAFLLIANVATAYTVVLKDGSTIIAKDKYRIEGERAFITLPSGTETFLPADQIDVERTRQANVLELGTAIVIEDGQRRRIEPGKPINTPRPKRISDLTRQGNNSTHLPGNSRRPTSTPADSTANSTVHRVATNDPDLAKLDHTPLADAALSTELETFFVTQGVEAARVFQGTTSRRPFILVVASSESAVFRTLTASATALSQLRQNHGNQIEGLELLILTATRTRAGQFFITPQLASQLTNKEIEPSDFFVRHVQF